MEYNNIIDNYLEKYGDPETERFVDLSLDFIDQVHSILEKKGLSQKDLAKKMNKSSAEVSKWLSGSHNMTFKSITKLSVALDEEIILTTLKAKEKYVGQNMKVFPLGVRHDINDNFDLQTTNEKIVFNKFSLKNPTSHSMVKYG